MNIKTRGFVYTLYFIGICRSYADLLIKVMNTTCDEPYNVALYHKITLDYSLDENMDTLKPCVLTIFSHRPEMEICAKALRAKDKPTCRNTFRYFTGNLLPWLLGYTCSDLIYLPLCTNQSTVYAVFHNNFRTFTQSSIKLQIYTKNISESIFLTVAPTTRRTTTHNWWYPNINNNNYDVVVKPKADKKTYPVGNFGTAIFIIVVGCSIIVICYLVYKKNSGTETPDILPSPRHLTRPDVPSSRRPSYTEDAPSYSSVIHQHEVPAGEVNISEQGLSNVDHGEALTLVSVCQTVDTPAPPRNQNGTNSTQYELDDNQTSPSDPPPEYSDVVPPPPYPGY